MKLKVYAGLSLQKSEVSKILPSAEFSGPIERGDIPRDVKRGFQTLIIIDGKFHSHSKQLVLSVSPSEIMDALRAGVRVYGSSSMGALRAGELWSFGMQGHGKIFEYIRQNEFFRDDFLGHLYFEGEHSVSVPSFIDFYFNLVSLQQTGEISGHLCQRLIRIFKSLHYSKRNFEGLSKKLKTETSSLPLAASKKALFAMGSQKHRDARSLLKKVRKDLKAIEPINASLRSK